ncbi:hypothetical protein AAFF_G00372360 [Aldrovandia affinis]|uniref:Uncharacterized protein n=1 Tax=Aldrovandia affinis TaxID=143900 RepID=A0AAD7SG90_9TELE|nr:hypothetical protein AAFF_G00372360 [Aldrovandia affinis]
MVLGSSERAQLQVQHFLESAFEMKFNALYTSEIVQVWPWAQGEQLADTCYASALLFGVIQLEEETEKSQCPEESECRRWATQRPPASRRKSEQGRKHGVSFETLRR